MPVREHDVADAAGVQSQNLEVARERVLNAARIEHRAVYRLNLLPSGDQTGRPQQVKSSGLPAYDRAVEAAIRKCNPFPKPKDQSASVPRLVELTFDPVEDNMSR